MWDRVRAPSLSTSSDYSDAGRTLELQLSRRYGRRPRRERRVRDAGGGVDLSLVKTLVREELSHDGIELRAVLSQQSPCFGIALVGNPPDFLVDNVEQTLRDPCHPRVAFRW